MRQTYGFSHRAGKMKYILAGCSFPLNNTVVFAIFVTCKYSSQVNRGATFPALIYNILITTLPDEGCWLLRNLLNPCWTCQHTHNPRSTRVLHLFYVPARHVYISPGTAQLCKLWARGQDSM